MCAYHETTFMWDYLGVGRELLEREKGQERIMGWIWNINNSCGSVIWKHHKETHHLETWTYTNSQCKGTQNKYYAQRSDLPTLSQIYPVNLLRLKGWRHCVIAYMCVSSGANKLPFNQSCSPLSWASLLGYCTCYGRCFRHPLCWARGNKCLLSSASLWSGTDRLSKLKEASLLKATRISCWGSARRKRDTC